ncbi:hypothetical protein C8J57DRAFT_1315998, partial [Mycena rebaudengoi]
WGGPCQPRGRVAARRGGANGNGHDNGGAVVEDADDEEHEQHYFGHPHDRVLSWVYLAHGFVPPALNALPGPRTILWSMTIEGLIEGLIKLALTGSLWFGCTVGILCLMEGSCTRWVEANSKHYEGGGYVRICSADFCEGFKW